MHKKRILIIDDDENFAYLVKMNLEHTGKYELKVESRPKFSLSDVMLFQPDLIVLDVVMFSMSGFDVASALKEHVFSKHIPVIFLTATLSEKDKVSDIILKGYPALAKPITANKLIECIEKNIQKNIDF